MFSVIGTDVWPRVKNFCSPLELAMLSMTCRDFSGNTKPCKIPMLAARAGYTDIIMWCQISNYQIGPEVSEAAALGGHLEILKWLDHRNYPRGKKVCSNAALGGHFETLKWAVENKYALNTRICSYAAKGGYFEMLVW